jgi:hypothetical protein
MRLERAYSQGNPIKTQPVVAVLVKTVKIEKNELHLVPQRALKPFFSNTVDFFSSSRRIRCPNGAVAAACSAHRGKSHVPKDAAIKIPIW